MSLTTVTHKLTDTAGAPVAGATVTVQLVVPGYDAANSQELAGPAYTVTAADGSYSFALTPNSLLAPVGTYYTVTHPSGEVQSFVVPESAAPVWLYDILVQSPSSPATFQYGVHTINGVGPDGVGNINLAGVAALHALNRALATGDRSAGIQVLTDSTGVSSDRWPYRLAALLAAKYPGWNVQQMDWDDTSQDYLAKTVVQTAAAGARYLDCSTGATTRRLDPSVSTNLTGVIDVRIKVAFTAWPPGAQVNLAGRSGGAGTRGWYLIFNTAGVPIFAYSADGTTVATMSAGAGVPVVANTPFWLRYVFTPNDGAGNRTFAAYTGTDGVTWTQVGATVTTAGAVVLHDPALGYELGGVASGVGASTLRVYEVQIRNGLNGPNIVPAMPDLWPPYSATAATFAGAPTLTVVNGARSGGTIAYLTDAVRLPKLAPNYGQAVTFLSSSHNEGQHYGLEFLPTIETFRSAAANLFGGGVPLVGLTQNPEVVGVSAGWPAAHASRRLDLIAYARAHGFDVIDTYGQFIADPGWAADYTDNDGTHPNSAGSTLWAQTLMNAIAASLTP